MSEVDWLELRKDFPASQVGHLPKGGTILDYVGHAWVTARLNAYGGDWVMEPVGDVQYPGEDLCWLQVRLTIGGVPRYEVGCADPRKQEFPKLLWSDCLTRAAMRHGIGLSMWQKETLDVPNRPQGRSQARGEAAPAPVAPAPDPDVAALLELLQEDVSHLDMVGLSAWSTWKANHPRWWLSVDLLVEGRNVVMELLAAVPLTPAGAVEQPNGYPEDPEGPM